MQPSRQQQNEDKIKPEAQGMARDNDSPKHEKAGPLLNDQSFQNNQPDSPVVEDKFGQMISNVTKEGEILEMNGQAISEQPSLQHNHKESTLKQGKSFDALD